MAAFATYSTTPALNVSIGGVDSDEDCAAANINNICRQIVAEGRQLYDIVAAIDVSSYMPKAGGAFTGDITRNSFGGYLYHANSAQSGGKVYTQVSSDPLPTSPAEGTVVFQYT
jgi:hypothetical protein